MAIYNNAPIFCLYSNGIQLVNEHVVPSNCISSDDFYIITTNESETLDPTSPSIDSGFVNRVLNNITRRQV